MNQPLLKSVILHLVLLLFIIISSWNIFGRTKTEIKEEAVTVDLLPIAKKTNVKPVEMEKKAEEPVKKKEEKKPEPKKPKEEKKEEPPKPSEKPSLEKPKDKPKDKPKKEKKSEELESLLKDLEKEKPKGKADAKEQKASNYDPNQPLSVSEMNYIQHLIIKQFKPCWNVPAGAREAGSLVVSVDIDIARDGSVKFVGFDDDSKYGGNGFYQAAADAARRAVLDPRCNPLKELPPMEKYEKWREITIEFDPSKLI